jgi:hypothetical protein
MQTAGTIAAAAMATGGTSGAPTPLVELPEQGVIALGDLALCVRIYVIWFDQRVTTDEMREMLLDAGLATVVGGALVYGGVKLTEGLLAEALNFLGPLGWGSPLPSRVVSPPLWGLRSGRSVSLRHHGLCRAGPSSCKDVPFA